MSDQGQMSCKTPEELEAEIVSKPTLKWDPFTVLPKEIYVYIFDKLDDDSKSQQTFINSHPNWRELLRSKRTSCLFPLVFEHLANPKREPTVDRSPDIFEDEEKPYNLCQDDFLNCRLVSRPWSRGVENYVQLHPSKFGLDPTDYFCLGLKDVPIFYKHYYFQIDRDFEWWSTEELEEELQDFVKTHPPSRNPFLTAEVTLHDSQEECPCCSGEEPDMEQVHLWWKKVTQLLELYGRHILHCKIIFDWRLTFEFYTQVRNWLTLMPNLKVLMIEYTTNHKPFKKADLKLLQTQISSCPIPEMKYLVNLDVEEVPPVLFNNLIPSMKGLERIEIKFGSWNKLYLGQYRLDLLDKIKGAFITIKGKEDYQYLEETRLSWPLEKLYINLAYEKDHVREDKSSNPEWVKKLAILERFPSLLELKLRFSMYSEAEARKTILEESLNYRFNLPKLQKLRICMSNLASLDFLLLMKDLRELIVVLEHLEWDSEDAKQLAERETIKFHLNFRNMFESNIWEVFPKLNKLEIYAACMTIQVVRWGRRMVTDINSYKYVRQGRKYLEKIVSPTADLPEQEVRQMVQ